MPISPRPLGVIYGLLCAVVCTGALYAAAAFFVRDERGQRVDELAFLGAKDHGGPLIDAVTPVVDLVSVPFIVVCLTIAMMIALIRRQWVLALYMTVLVGGANLSTQFIKEFLLERPDLGYGTLNSWPSGHTTVAVSITAVFVMVVPRNWRPFVAVLGAFYTSATGVGTIANGWHRPSDVFAAFLVTGAWTGLTIALAPTDQPRPNSRPTRTVTAVAAGTLGILTISSGLWASRLFLSLPRPLELEDSNYQSPAYLGGILAVFSVSCLMMALLLLIRQATGRPRWYKSSSSAKQAKGSR